jgi:hypothetical protein
VLILKFDSLTYIDFLKADSRNAAIIGRTVTLTKCVDSVILIFSVDNTVWFDNLAAEKSQKDVHFKS